MPMVLTTSVTTTSSFAASSLTASALLEKLAARGVTLGVEGEHLLVGPKDALDEELRAEIRAHKAQLLAMLADQHCPVALSALTLRQLTLRQLARHIEHLLQAPYLRTHEVFAARQHLRELTGFSLPIPALWSLLQVCQQFPDLDESSLLENYLSGLNEQGRWIAEERQRL